MSSTDNVSKRYLTKEFYKVIDRNNCQKVIDTICCKEVMSSTKKCFAKKPVAEIFLMKKRTKISALINKNNSVEKIIGRLVVRKIL